MNFCKFEVKLSGNGSYIGVVIASPARFLCGTSSNVRGDLPNIRCADELPNVSVVTKNYRCGISESLNQ